MFNESWLGAVERHLGAVSPLIQELCLLSTGEDGGARAVVVPNARELSAQKVPLVLARLGELLRAAAVGSPYPVRLEDLITWDAPLPRTAAGELDRPAIAARVRLRASDAARPQRREVLEGAAALRLLGRLEAVLELPGPFAPSQHLERDLGVDSLLLVQLRLLLEQEFGVRIADEDLWRVQTLADVLERVAAVKDPPPDPGRIDTSWAARLREAPTVPLREQFNLDRRGVFHLAARAGMWAVSTFSRLAFRAELVHRERLPTDGPFLLCPSHQSFLDSMLVYAIFPNDLVDRTVFIAFGPYFHSAPASWLVRMGRIILTGEGDSVADSMRLASAALRQGLNVCIFPEGARSYTGDVMPPRPGLGLLACEAQVPIVPVLYDGSEGTYSPQRPGFHPVKIRAVVGEPIAPPPMKAFRRADYQELASRWHAALVDMARDSERGRGLRGRVKGRSGFPAPSRSSARSG